MSNIVDKNRIELLEKYVVELEQKNLRQEKELKLLYKALGNIYAGIIRLTN